MSAGEFSGLLLLCVTFAVSTFAVSVYAATMASLNNIRLRQIMKKLDIEGTD